MPTTITGLTTYDVRFPTSEALDGSDAMNPDPDYSAAYCILHTDSRLEGHGLTFTIGRGNELCVAAIEALRPLVVGRTLESVSADPGAFWQEMVGDSQLRWVGPEKGVIHLHQLGFLAHQAKKLCCINLGFATRFATGIQGRPQQVDIADARDFNRILETEKKPGPCPFFRFHGQQVLVAENHRSGSDRIAVTTSQNMGEGTFA